jgi:hypothetical protein
MTGTTVSSEEERLLRRIQQCDPKETTRMLGYAQQLRQLGRDGTAPAEPARTSS